MSRIISFRWNFSTEDNPEPEFGASTVDEFATAATKAAGNFRRPMKFEGELTSEGDRFRRARHPGELLFCVPLSWGDGWGKLSDWAVLVHGEIDRSQIGQLADPCPIDEFFCLPRIPNDVPPQDVARRNAEHCATWARVWWSHALSRFDGAERKRLLDDVPEEFLEAVERLRQEVAKHCG